VILQHSIHRTLEERPSGCLSVNVTLQKRVHGMLLSLLLTSLPVQLVLLHLPPYLAGNFPDHSDLNRTQHISTG
jgi:hypothetical protein